MQLNITGNESMKLKIPFPTARFVTPGTRISGPALAALLGVVIALGLCGLLETTFDTVVMVANETSLLTTATQLRPQTVVVDLSLARQSDLRWLRSLRQSCPELTLIALSVHDEASVRQAALEAGADGFVLNRAIATDLLPAIDTALQRRQQSPLTKIP